MKRPNLILVLVLVTLLAACHRPADLTHTPSLHPKLAAIDTLMQTRPDSALVLLLDEPMDDPYYHLLLSEALFKNDYTQANRQELLSAVTYFDSLNTVPFLSARAHYIKGVGYYEQDSVVPACAEYLKALEIMEEHFSEKEIIGYKAKFMALTNTRLCGLFSDQYLHEQAIYFGKQALHFYYTHNAEPWNIVWILENIGTNYDMMDKLDSAYYYYNEALNVLPDTNCLIYRDIATIQIYLSYRQGVCADSSLKRLNELLAQTESEKELLSRYAIIGGVYYNERMCDSAWKYLETVFSASSNIALKKQSAEWLAEICRAQNKNHELIEYASFLIPFANQEENKSELKSQLTELYNVYHQTRIERKHKQLSNKQLYFYFIFIGFFLVIIFVVIALYRKSLKHRQTLKEQMVVERNAHQVQQAALSGRLKQSNRKVRDMKQIINRQDNHQIKDLVKETKTFEDEPICRDILERVKKGQFKSQMDCLVYKSYALDKIELLALRKAADCHFNMFTVRLQKKYPKLTNIDIDYCCLYLLGLTDADISALMQRAYNTINERNNKLKKIMDSNNSITASLRSFSESQLSN